MLEDIGCVERRKTTYRRSPETMGAAGRVAERAPVEYPGHFICPIGHSLMRDPVICEDGHTYERENIEQWLRRRRVSPMTNQPLVAHQPLIANINLRQAIAAHCSS